MPGPVKGVVPAQATQQAGKPGRQAGDNKSDTLHKGYQPAGHRRLSGVIEGQHQAQGKRAAQTDAAGESPERGEVLRQPDEAAEANQLERQSKQQKLAPVILASQRRQQQRARGLPNRQQRQQRAAVLGAVAKLHIIGRQPGDQTGVAGIDQSEIEPQRPGAALANNRYRGAALV